MLAANARRRKPLERKHLPDYGGLAQPFAVAQAIDGQRAGPSRHEHLAVSHRWIGELGEHADTIGSAGHVAVPDFIRQVARVEGVQRSWKRRVGTVTGGLPKNPGAGVDPLAEIAIPT